MSSQHSEVESERTESRLRNCAEVSVVHETCNALNSADGGYRE